MMPGNSPRRGATRRTGSKKGATVGSGGQRRRALEGRGPTPKAEDRVKHKANKAKAARDRAEAWGEARGEGGRTGATGAGRSTGGGPRSGNRRQAKGAHEIVAGRNAVLEALRAGVPATTVYIAPRIESDDRTREILKIAREANIPVLEAPRGELDRITAGAVHQGVALQVPPYEYTDPHDLIDPEQPGIPLLVALDGITDPRNLGAIIRSVAAFGGHGVIVPARRSVGMTASAWKSSAGAAARTPVAQATNLVRALEDYRKAGFFVIGLDMVGAVPLTQSDLADTPLVVVVGAEGKGLSRLVRETCDQIVSIPMSSTVESLNASVAVSITLYDVATRRAAARG